MAIISSQDLNRILNPQTRKLCKSCGLYLNQSPVFDTKKESKIFWVGLSAVQFHEDEEKQPLSPFTRSGALIERIETPFINEISFYKTNIVKCLPLKNDKIRYPVEHEMEKCFPNFEMEVEELKPSLIFLLGRQVGLFVTKKIGAIDVGLDENFKYEKIVVDKITYIPIHHPSYVLVYKRKYIDDYIRGIQSFFMKKKSFKKKETILA